MYPNSQHVSYPDTSIHDDGDDGRPQTVRIPHRILHRIHHTAGRILLQVLRTADHILRTVDRIRPDRRTVVRKVPGFRILRNPRSRTEAAPLQTALAPT